MAAASAASSAGALALSAPDGAQNDGRGQGNSGHGCHFPGHTDFDISSGASVCPGDPGQDREQIVEQNAQQDSDQGVGDMFHGAGQTAALAFGVDLAECSVRAVKLFAARSIFVNIVRDGPGVRFGNSFQSASV